MSPRYTIIIPHYDLPESLDRLLSSIPKRADVQVIVSDDCSPRPTLEKLSELHKKYPEAEWVSTGTNGGAGKARNIALKQALGKFLIFADADDFFTPCFNDMLDKYADSEYDLIYFAANSVDTETYQNSGRDSAVTMLVNQYLNHNDPEKTKYRFTAPWCKFISREMVEKNGIVFQESRVFNDMRFSQSVDYHSKSFHADNHAIYCVTTRKNSVSSVTKPEKEVLKMQVASQYFKFAKEHNIFCYPVWVFLGSTYNAVCENNWEEYKPLILAPWKEIGLTDWQIKKALIYQSFINKLVIPVKKIIQAFE